MRGRGAYNRDFTLTKYIDLLSYIVETEFLIETLAKTVFTNSSVHYTECLSRCLVFRPIKQSGTVLLLIFILLNLV